MRSDSIRLAAAALSVAGILGFAGLAAGQGGNPGTALTADQWRADLRALASTLAEKHRNAFFKTSRADFDRAVAALEARLPSLRDHEVIVGLAEIAARLGDGHTRLALPFPQGEVTGQAHTPTPAPAGRIPYFRQLPVRLSLFKEGLFVQAATREHADLIGLEVTRIGPSPAAKALETVRPIVNYDNEMGFKLHAPAFLGVAEVVHAYRLSDSPDLAELAFRDAAGREVVKILAALETGAKADWVTGPARLAEQGKPVPAYLRKPAEPFWFEHLAPERTVYVQVNAIQDRPEEKLAAFAERLIAYAEARPVDRLVLDIRENGGGNNYLNRSLILALSRSPKINRYGRLFVIVGRKTFSAAMNLCSLLELWTNAIFVGEPTGSTTSHYGDARRYPLPNSGLTVRASSVYWRDYAVDEKRIWIAPDIPAEPSAAAYFSGLDPAMAAIRSFPVDESLFGQMKTSYLADGPRAAYLRYYKFTNDPATAAADTEADLNKLGADLAAGKKYADAADVFSLNVADHPKSFEAHLGMGEALLLAGKKAEAIQALEKALALRPGDPKADALLRRAREK